MAGDLYTLYPALIHSKTWTHLHVFRLSCGFRLSERSAKGFNRAHLSCVICGCLEFFRIAQFLDLFFITTVSLTY